MNGKTNAFKLKKERWLLNVLLIQMQYEVSAAFGEYQIIRNRFCCEVFSTKKLAWDKFSLYS